MKRLAARPEDAQSRLAFFMLRVMRLKRRLFLAIPKRYFTSLHSHQLISASRQKPLSARIRIFTKGHLWRISFTRRCSTSRAPSLASMSAFLSCAHRS